MKHPRTTFPMLCTLLLFAGLVACEGPTGPEGPQGEQGSTGTANVQYSDWTPFDAASWSDPFSEFGQMRREYPVAEPAIDSEILETGTVAVYVRIPGIADDKVYPLPWISHIVKPLPQVLDYEVEPGSIAITLFDLVDDSVDPGTVGSVVEYRYVVIPGGVSLAASSSVDLGDYRAVVEAFGLTP